jgi:hypothetical protein
MTRQNLDRRCIFLRYIESKIWTNGARADFWAES